MTVEVLAVALVAGTAGSAVILAAWLDLHRSVKPDGPRPAATDPALEAEKKRLADLKAELAAAETRTSDRERQISVKLRDLTAAERERTEAAERERTEAATELTRQEAALARRERNLEWSLAAAARSAAEATARIEAREAVLATQEAGLQQHERELADRHRSVAEHERELIRAKAIVTGDLAQNAGRLERQMDWRESDWWEKQLGRPLSAKVSADPSVGVADSSDHPQGVVELDVLD